MNEEAQDTPKSNGALKTVAALAILALLVAGVVGATGRRAQHDLGWPDEWIYLTLARNLTEKGSLNTNFYIASSIQAIGYPHRDVHLPGYALALAAVGSFTGVSLDSAVELNVLCFAITVFATLLLARRFLSPGRSLIAASCAALVPPYAGYLWVVYPEHVTAAALLVLIAMAAWIERASFTVLLGAAFGASLLFRETLLLSFPVFAFLLGPRRTLRLFLPGLALAVVLVVAPLSKQRAIHPNALYPSAVTEALATSEPLTHLTHTVLRNVQANVGFLISSDPLRSAEDAVLLFLLGLALLGGIASLGVEGRARGFLNASALATAVLFAAMLVLYVVRERGGVWGGVRALMPMAPLLLIGLCGLRVGRAFGAVLLTALISLSLFLTSWQIAFFNRYKGINLEDQTRASRFIDDRTRRFAPRRIVGGRYFQYGFEHFPVEVVWRGPEDMRGLDALYLKFPFDFVIVHRRDPLRFDLRKDARYEWTNAFEGQAAEYQVYRRAER